MLHETPVEYLTDEFLHKYKEIFGGLDRGSSWTLNYQTVFLLRRYILVVVTVSLYDR